MCVLFGGGEGGAGRAGGYILFRTATSQSLEVAAAAVYTAAHVLVVSVGVLQHRGHQQQTPALWHMRGCSLLTQKALLCEGEVRLAVGCPSRHRGLRGTAAAAASGL